MKRTANRTNNQSPFADHYTYSTAYQYPSTNYSQYSGGSHATSPPGPTREEIEARFPQLKSSTPKLYDYKLKKALKKPEFRAEYELFINPPPTPEESRTYGTETLESMMRAEEERDREETKIGNDDYGDESASSGYGSYDDEDVDELGQLDPEVFKGQVAADVRPMPARTPKLEALMAEEEAAR